jgi:uncharacterized repeat protein (TIGR03803 family)
MKKQDHGIMNCLIRGVAIALFLANSVWAATAEQVLYNFQNGRDGGLPQAGLVFDSAGNLYGTTNGGGTSAVGTVFKLLPTRGGVWTEKVLHSFTGGTDGARPTASLTLDANGNLYGTTQAGGTGNGVVFKLSPHHGTTWTETVLHTFTGGLDGQFPSSNVIFDSFGNLYGTTAAGGSKNFGVVFQLTPSPTGWVETVLHNFLGGSDQQSPSGSLTMDRRGRIYGTCTAGVGSVYRLTKNATTGKWSYRQLYYFGNGGGEEPLGGLVVDSQFRIFGTTYVGCCGFGNVFELVQSGSKWTLTEIHPFLGSDGSNPNAGLVQDSAGNLFGTTSFGGDFGAGVVFEMVWSGGTFTYSKLHSFGGFTRSDGAAPVASVILDAAGNLYGTTLGGGAIGGGLGGTVFEVTP